jgi:hypothetical protein
VSGIINFAKLKLLRSGRTGVCNLVKEKDTSFIPPRRGGGSAKAFQSLFRHTDGKIRDGYGEDGCGRKVVGT